MRELGTQWVQKVKFPKGVKYSSIEKEVRNTLTWANFLAFDLSKFTWEDYQTASLILETIEDLVRVVELKRVRVQESSRIAALVEHQARPTYNNNPAIAGFIRTAKRRRHELALVSKGGNGDDTKKNTTPDPGKNTGAGAINHQ
ncbi:hypothetical protein SARC_04006 [Sphaeroforma arctica JP610]|uniref:Uncharacterized protein n=1 Tax=Sphaeroforma arctica JP610 TaxID=667725 RepID=A0A0L0G4M4_9EUKA|nr:hypothetical protein SARC_04006 [Sphaeroforma arctica JP610]KNC83756.1 hypothetical protein SARC_04006 [Sphaeroforma arctica JP610]|eukprot:XP_014157658.1 hypothetical protein SARC_04006 [Sphaeroforma arctica JP610]